MKKEKPLFDYSALIGRYLEEQYELERKAELSKFTPATPSGDHEVYADICCQGREWVVYLVFRDTEDRTTFFRTAVKTCRSRHIAEIIGTYQCRIRSSAPESKPEAGATGSSCWN